MIRSCAVLLPLCLCAVLATASSALAQPRSSWFVSPFIGLSTGGDATVEAPVMGLSTGWVGRRLGVEGEIADAPEFFEQDGFRTDRRVTTLMATALYVPWTAGALSVYGAGGLGLVRPRLAEAGDLARVEIEKLGFNAGGGVMARFSGRAGVRGDVRYVRTMGATDTDVHPFGLDFSKFHFWRVSVGLVATF